MAFLCEGQPLERQRGRARTPHRGSHQHKLRPQNLCSHSNIYFGCSPMLTFIFRVACLYRFDKEVSNWVTEGNGTLTLSKNLVVGTVCIVMPKLDLPSTALLNFPVHPDLDLEENVASKQAWIMRAPANAVDWQKPRDKSSKAPTADGTSHFPGELPGDSVYVCLFKLCSVIAAHVWAGVICSF